MTTGTSLKNRLAVVAVALAALATLVLIAQLSRPTGTTAGATAVTQSDGSFDRAEYRRQLSVLESGADGFDRAEHARFERVDERASDVAGQTGFERAEAERHHRLAAG